MTIQTMAPNKLDQPDRPDKPCHICKRDAWYWPGDYYFGSKAWLCGFCHPKPDGADDSQRQVEIENAVKEYRQAFHRIINQGHTQAELLRLRAGFDGCGCADCQELYATLDLDMYGARVKRRSGFISIVAGITGADLWEKHHQDDTGQPVSQGNGDKPKPPEKPPAKVSEKPVSRLPVKSNGKKGRNPYSITLDAIYDTLKQCSTVTAAAVKLGCSRGYIYRYVTPEKVKEVVEAK